MKSISFLSLLFVLSLMSSCNQSGENNFQFEIPEGKEPQKTTYYFVRHAEKDTTNPENEDPQLSEKGIRRANYLASYFSDKELDLFYSTDYSRTIQTLIPTVQQFEGEIQNYDGKKDTLFNKSFWENTYGKDVLVIGHSNTSPRFVNEILSENKYENLNEMNYDEFFKVEIDKDLTIKDLLINEEVPENFNYNQIR